MIGFILSTKIPINYVSHILRHLYIDLLGLLTTYMVQVLV